MKVCLLTEQDKELISQVNRKNGYGLSKQMLSRLIMQHESARKISDYKTMQKIEYRLEQINYHYENGLLSAGLYEEAKKTLSQWDN